MQLCMAWMSVSALLHSDDDAVCNPVVVVHDHAAHHVGASSSTAGPQQDHCFICHSLSMRSLAVDAGINAPLIASQSIATSPALEASSPVVALRPARAPPLA